MKAAIDSSSLIFLFKLEELLALLKKRYSGVIVPPAVYEEVVIQGKLLGKSDVLKIELGLKASFFKQGKETGILPFEQLDPGEAQALFTANKHKIPLISDDRAAYRVGMALGINVIPLSAFIIWAAKKKLLQKSKALEILENLIQQGYYLKTQTYLKLKEAIQNA